ncbi:MAG: GSCFA domain-containing protein [Flavobacteriales bacterium]|nr:GSCFA domain-containing protein [Flavobacteriales bacterium]
MSSFRTEITIAPAPFRLNHQHRIVSYGSCFAENMSEKLEWYRFATNTNSHGIIFNPYSVAMALEDVISLRKYHSSDLIFANGFYHSMNHHGRFSGENPDVVCDEINQEIERMHRDLKEANLLLITFGTAWYYRLLSNQQVVANCHKMLGSDFSKEMAAAQEIVSTWKRIIDQLLQLNHNLKLVLTVSPVRHLRDGFHENQLSKANLLLAVDELCKSFSHVHYFPSYEILMDDLRDYRFCTDDMVHPSQEAIGYIWEKFSQWLMDDQTLNLLKSLNPLLKYLDHRPLKIGIDQHQIIVSQKEKEVENLISEFRQVNAMK